jgi:hypothetical protein
MRAFIKDSSKRRRRGPNFLPLKAALQKRRVYRQPHLTTGTKSVKWACYQAKSLPAFVRRHHPLMRERF